MTLLPDQAQITADQWQEDLRNETIQALQQEVISIDQIGDIAVEGVLNRVDPEDSNVRALREQQGRKLEIDARVDPDFMERVYCSAAYRLEMLKPPFVNYTSFHGELASATISRCFNRMIDVHPKIMSGTPSIEGLRGDVESLGIEPNRPDLALLAELCLATMRAAEKRLVALGGSPVEFQSGATILLPSGLEAKGTYDCEHGIYLETNEGGDKGRDAHIEIYNVCGGACSVLPSRLTSGNGVYSIS